MAKEGCYDHMAEEYDKFIEEVRKSGYPLWMVEMYGFPPVTILDEPDETDDVHTGS